MKLGIRRGQLTKWKDDRGFGFIQPVDGSQEIFLHISELKDATRRPQVGDTIYYHAVAGQDGKLSACNAFILGARSKPTASSLNNKATSNAASTSPFPVLEVLLLSILPLVGAIHFAWTTSNPLPLILYPAMSLLTFALYADDKSRANRRAWRTPEKTLHLCELAGGWLGGFVAQRRLRHKSSKKSYQAVFWAIVTIHYIVWLIWLFLGKSTMS
ncbi:MAG: cold shock and DUF1294 domain-containing protein [Symplocastrum torsivum CPER-KK1]|jgi:uncharacterized membrane protein YsdA (DUF1294 family)/cold shock CspA family protein|uniref:Cold shock and DUF1294 domain-containing protein n=1 Tax=Symplocastrum torsivum CPER-KK1 TaxID=450513 RepID=A0A951U8W3_9CYAN|nr:cold shock and DUF1294 domain-containing protein [Symplocastrum torsivum CPER-KK1]